MKNNTTDSRWESVKTVLKDSLSEQNYYTWIKPIQLNDIKSDKIVLSVSSDFQMEWIKNNYYPRIESACQTVFGKTISITIIVVEDQENETAAGVQTPLTKIDIEDDDAPKFYPKYTFNKFVVGRSNEFAFEAAKRVAIAPGQTYNPLLIYGGSGLGKTHLLQSVGHKIVEDNSLLKVMFRNCQEFIDDLVTAIKYKSADEFRRNYREIDVLLIDDIHFITRGDFAQEEFFNTFNNLHLKRKQIVITSDRLPNEIKGLADRLKSRFEWGGTVPIEAPDFETRKAILSNFIRDQNTKLIFPEDVVDYISENIKSNIRSLEGACLNTIIYAEIHNCKISIDLVREAIKDILVTGIDNVSTETIQKVVSDYYNVSMVDMKSKKKTKEISHARNIAIFLVRELTNFSLSEIGEEFGFRDHATISYSINLIKKKFRNDNKIKMEVERIRSILQKK